MPCLKWDALNPQQLGRYAEYYAMMEFTSYRYEVYETEVDDHGVDFIVKARNTSEFYEVQVKSLRKSNYVYIQKEKFQMDDHHLVCFLKFTVGKMPDVYLIPMTAWETKNGVFVERNYGKGKKSKPEWGINYSKKNKHLLEPYRIEKFFEPL
jgi:hypothetical protein